MSERLRELASALMDGEADERELRHLSLKDNEAVRDSWRHYHQVQSALKAESIPFAKWDISNQVKHKLAGKPEKNTINTSFSRWFRPIGSLAVAASVALVIVFGANNINPVSTEIEYQSPLVDRTTDKHSGEIASTHTVHDSTWPLSGGAVEATSNQATQQHLEKHMVRHTQSTAFNNNQHMFLLAKTAHLGVD